VTTVFVAGWGRSGSTVLGAILGELPGWLSVGELRHLFAPGITCGCGELAATCPFWQEVVGLVEREHGTIDTDRFGAEQWRAAAPKQVPRLLYRGVTAVGADYVVSVTDALYRAARQVSGDDVIVDVSKHPGSAALVSWAPDTFLVHLVRDPRATAYSWSHRKMPRVQSMGTGEATLRWAEWNALTDLVLRRLPPGRRMRLRYEDFMRDPRGSVYALAAQVDPELATRGLPEGLFTARGVHLGPNHMVDGNPSRFRTGDVSLVLDDVWRQELGARERALVTTVAWPLMLRYRYLLDPESRTPRPTTERSARQ
jgi:hypothetical protein